METLRSLSQQSGLPRLEFQMLWEHLLNVPRVWLIAHDTDPLDASKLALFRKLEGRRLAGEPMAYIIGRREFMGRDFKVTPAVLIPRPETELLVETALDFLKDRPRPRVLDMGTGTGAIAISIRLERPDATVIATDISPEALDVARENSQVNGARLHLLHGSWYDALEDHRDFDLIVSNPPYISAADPHLLEGDIRFEPVGALTDGHDGLMALRTIVQGAAPRLVPHGALFMEHGWDQADAVRQLLQRAGFTQVVSLPDLAGIERVTGGIYN